MRREIATSQPHFPDRCSAAVHDRDLDIMRKLSRRESSPVWTHRQTGAPSLVSSENPSARNRSPNAACRAWQVISATHDAPAHEYLEEHVRQAPANAAWRVEDIEVPLPAAR
jgi:hypothetical protein